MAKDRIEIEVLAKGVKDAQKDIKGLKKEIGKTGEQTKTSGESMVGTFAAIAAGAFAAFQTIKKGMSLAKEFALFQQSTKAMEAQFGVSSDKIIKKLNEVAKGTISNADLISSANRAMALNVTTDIDEMAQLMEVARVRGQAMGLDTEQAFSDLVTGIGRGSPLILDNLGIITKGWDKEAKEAGKAMDTQFILNKVLQDGAAILEKTGDVALTNAEKFQQMEATAKNIRLVIGEQLLPEVLKVTDAFRGMGEGKGLEFVIRGVRSLVALVRFLALQFTMTWRLFVSLVTPFITAIQSVIDNFDSLKKAVAGFGDVLAKLKTGDFIGALQELKEVGTDTFDALRETGNQAFTETLGRLKEQLNGAVGELGQFKESFVSIFAEIEKAESEFVERQKESSDSLVATEKKNRESITRIYQNSVKAMTDALFDFNKSAKEKLKEVFMAIIDTIANEIVARGMAMIGLGIATLRPDRVARGTALVASASAIKGIGAAVTSKFRTGTDFSPEGTALVGEDGPEIVELPQGARVVPNNQVTNNSNDNRNITINVQANDSIEFVNDLQSTYGINVFEGG
jgi:hypothetical protein